MMGRLNHDQGQFFYSFRLDEAVPDDHLVRELAAVLDLSWVHSELAPFYPQLGRPSIDPELMIRCTRSTNFANDADVPLLDSDALILGLKSHFLSDTRNIAERVARDP